MLSDLELIRNEKGHFEGARWEAVYEKSTHFFTARTKREAVRIAREYGKRIINDKLLSIITT